MITAYDEGMLLVPAVESVLAQVSGGEAPLPVFEILLVHDRGADAATMAAIEVIRKRHPRVRILENERRKGVGGARNTGISSARGEWIAFLDGDDLWFPTALAVRWRALAQAPDVGWVASDFHRGRAPDSVENPAGFTVGNPYLCSLMSQGMGKSERLPMDGETVRLRRPVSQFCRASLCWTGTVMARRSLIEAVGGFSERIPRGEDVHLWIRLAAASDLVFVRRPLALYRTRPSTLARRGKSVRGWDIVATLDLLRRPSLWSWFSDFYPARLIRMMNEQAAHRRGERKFAAAAGWSFVSGLSFPFQARAWKILAASLLRRA